MTDELTKLLKNKVRYWAGETTKLAKKFAPTHLKSKISSHVEERGDGTFIIRTIAVAPDAGAQEYGSGLRARRGPKHTYVIKPRNKKVLAFYWEVLDNPDTQQGVFDSPKFVGFAPDGRGLFRYVDHPGIEAVNQGRGYIRPAEIEIRKKIKADLGAGVPNAIRATLKLGFKR